MPGSRRKGVAATAKANILEHLRTRPKLEFTLSQLATQFRSSNSYVRDLLGELRATGWEVNERRDGNAKVYRVVAPELREGK